VQNGSICELEVHDVSCNSASRHNRTGTAAITQTEITIVRQGGGTFQFQTDGIATSEVEQGAVLFASREGLIRTDNGRAQAQSITGNRNASQVNQRLTGSGVEVSSSSGA